MSESCPSIKWLASAVATGGHSSAATVSCHRPIGTGTSGLSVGSMTPLTSSQSLQFSPGTKVFDVLQHKHDQAFKEDALAIIFLSSVSIP